MSKADTVMVQPTSTYFDHGERKSVESEPYKVARAHGEELRTLGIATIVEDKPVAEEPAAPPAQEAGPAQSATAEEPSADESEADEQDESEEPDDEDEPAPLTSETVQQPTRRRGRPRKSA
jgi:hypothetical protein